MSIDAIVCLQKNILYIGIEEQRFPEGGGGGMVPWAAW